MQFNLFGIATANKITIEQAAKTAQVSVATIRNWIKTGYLKQEAKGSVTQASFNSFMQHIAGKEKLHARANKLSKNSHNHTEASKSIDYLIEIFTGENIGLAYENSLTEAYRNKEGIYYTPPAIVRDMLSNITIHSNATFLDPCCGSGNFVIQAIQSGIPPQNVYGFDIDENAVAITKNRIKQTFGFDSPNIIVGDFLQETTTLSKAHTTFDYIFTNPPWGKKIDKSTKEKFAEIYKCGNSLDTTSLFMGASLHLLKPNGILGFLIQEAFFNITAFEDIRKKVLAKNVLKFIDYGKAFKGLVTKAQAIILENTPATAENKITCIVENSTHYRSFNSFNENPKTIFNFSTSEEESLVIQKLYTTAHITLKNKAQWALGIVTGNNQKFCNNTPKEGYIPIYKGSDITKTGLKKPHIFIENNFANFQQVAPLKMYLAQEKLIYKFISSNLCFYCDTQQQYILNSANLLIPTNIGISGKQLAELLNSEIINWLFNKLFATHKVLRSDLELLPIHTGYFAAFQEFTEHNYLNYLQITKSKHGTFSVKNVCNYWQ